ncbi:Gfo/Idh/MocA family oxidoreductase [Sinomonas sp. ASV486]|uniref:Gfo/Idh/MocA family protein n=1 Tax=Sinomonas sp. ASV486 TaxID=3051170 RepID=UPI0027DB7902|nr:Gfo/Idh/MocA family oxidoreductase [Sinomonas sp. ASV486]MDQ4490825.1 Gfo/Idh/MocA family oxidoreductase [Sinomonas sp. ASV486]
MTTTSTHPFPAEQGRGTTGRTGPRIAILGTGMIGAVHRRAALLAGAELVGAMASTPDRSAEAAAQWGTEPLSRPEDLQRLRPDVVHVCSPNGLHAEHVEAALEAGAHVICEKPLSVDSAQAIRLARLASEHGKVATVPFVYRFHPLVREIRARAAQGEFGPWQILHGSYLQDWLLSPASTSWRVGASTGGPSRAFADIGSHWCDLMEFVTGERISSVLAEMTTTVPERPSPGRSDEPPVPVDTEDAAAVVFRTDSGVLGQVTVSQVSAGRKNRLWFEFDGAHKSAVFDQENPETVWLGSEERAEVVPRDPARGSAEQRRLSVLPAGHPQGYAQCFENFIADTYAVVGGEERQGLPTFADGVRSACIVDAVIESARTRTWTEVSPV